MFISYFFILGFMAVLMLVFQFHIIALTGYQTESVLAALTIMTVFINFVVLAKRY